MTDFRNFNQENFINETRIQRLRLKRVRKARLITVLVTFFIVTGALAYSTYVHADGLFNYVKGGAAGSLQAAAVKPFDQGEEKWLNVLLLGVDQRKNEPARSDTLMVAMFNLRDKTVQVVSLPRDTRVNIEGIGYKTRINHARSKGGVELTRQTVEQFLGIPIHNYVETNFDGFANIIDILGGVNLEVEKRMYYPAEDIDLKKGQQNLVGRDALAYVRFRSDGKGDLPRIERQHKFLKVLADEVLQPKTILKLPKIAGELHENITTDMAVGDLLSLAGKFRDINRENIRFANVPGAPKYVNGASYYIVEEEELAVFMEKILEGQDPLADPLSPERENI